MNSNLKVSDEQLQAVISNAIICIDRAISRIASGPTLPKCRKCGATLFVGENITENGVKHNRLICKPCISAYDKLRYQKNKAKAHPVRSFWSKMLGLFQ